MSEDKIATLEGLEENGAFLQPVDSSAITPQQPGAGYALMLQGTATNRFRASATKNIVLDRNGNATIEQEGFKAFMKDYAKLKGGLNTGTKKMLDMGAIKLTELNHYRAKKGQAIDTAVSIALEEYGLMRGYDIMPRQTVTPEEKEAEKKRLSNVMHEIRKRANAELALLYSLSLTWAEPGKKKDGDFEDVRVLQKKGIRNGYINMRFSEDMANYLIHAYMMQYPTALQAIDERNPRTYNVGYKLAYHYGNDNNRKAGTYNILSVKSVLDACGDIPTYEEVQASKDRGHWERRIKDPLEAVLDKLSEDGILTEWEYCNSKRAPLEDGQISILDYQTFTDLYIHFEMPDMPDQTERLQRKAERIEAREKKSRKQKKAKQGSGD